MKRILFGVFLAFSMTAASPAFATGELICSDPGGEASVDFGIGRVPVLAIVSAHITANGQVWSTQPGKGEIEVIVGQAADDGRYLIADFTDPNVEQVLVSVRLLRSIEGEDYAQAGTLTVPGSNAYPLVCDEP